MPDLKMTIGYLKGSHFLLKGSNFILKETVAVPEVAAAATD